LDRGFRVCASKSGLTNRESGGLSAGGHPQQASASFGPAACAATLVARLLVIFSASHFLLDARVLDQLSETLDGIRNRFMLAQTQLDHKILLVTLIVR
jgi:hypothetical protein